MKAKSKVQVRILTGLVDAPCYHQWEQEVSGMKFKFALHPEAGHPLGFIAPLAISELGTGFDVKAVTRHPKTKAVLTTANVAGLSSASVKSAARAALYNLLHHKIGPDRFMRAMLGAQMQLSKIDLSKYDVSAMEENAARAGLTQKGIATVTHRFEGAADEYTPSPEEFAASMADAETMNENMAKYGTIDAPDPNEPILTEEDLPSLRHQREQLQSQVDQHGTMTGDTTERDYEDLTDEIADLDCMIQALEGTPCSN